METRSVRITGFTPHTQQAPIQTPPGVRTPERARGGSRNMHMKQARYERARVTWARSEDLAMATLKGNRLLPARIINGVKPGKILTSVRTL